MSNEEQFKKTKNNSKKETVDEIESLIPPEVLSVKQEITSDDLKEKFPNLHAEMTNDNMKIKIDDVEESFSRSEETDQTLDSTDLFRNFEPSTIDFIRRAQSDKEAEEIIRFTQQQGNISPEEAVKLLDQLSKEGVRSFGPIKTPGHYFRKAVESRNRQLIGKRYSIPK
ncbi:MAG: DUF2095 family protein [Candidatus Kariarchaeaceae archaeon]|jgi:hypothetical protein